MQMVFSKNKRNSGEGSNIVKMSIKPSTHLFNKSIFQINQIKIECSECNKK